MKMKQKENLKMELQKISNFKKIKKLEKKMIQKKKRN
jgi:hypothetical protein